MENSEKKTFHIDKHILIQFIKFGLVGISNAVVLLLFYYGILFINPDWYLLGNAVGWFASVLNAFFWGNQVIFKNERNTPTQILKKLAKSYLSYGFTFFLSQGLLYCEHEFLDVSTRVAPIINILITTPINFVVNKFWTFR